jgi:hypothetical protein
MRQTVIVLRLAGLLGATDRELEAHLLPRLMMNVYCHADAAGQAQWFGDDIGLKGFTVTELDVFYQEGTPKVTGAGSPGVAVAPPPADPPH